VCVGGGDDAVEELVQTEWDSCDVEEDADLPKTLLCLSSSLSTVPLPKEPQWWEIIVAFAAMLVQERAVAVVTSERLVAVVQGAVEPAVGVTAGAGAVNKEPPDKGYLATSSSCCSLLLPSMDLYHYIAEFAAAEVSEYGHWLLIRPLAAPNIAFDDGGSMV
jgi:hypothetical protein